MLSAVDRWFARYPGLLLAIPPFLWAGSHVVGRAIAGEIPPAGLAVGRWLIAIAALLPFAWPHLKADWPTIRSRPGVLIFLSLVGAGVFGTLQFVALQYTKALNVAVMNSVAPAMIIATSVVLFRDRISLLQVLGITISFAGTLVVVARGSLEALAALDLNGGDVLVVCNMMLWAIYSACLRLKPPMHPLSFMLVISVLACLTNVPAAAFEAWQGRDFPFTWVSFWTCAYVGLGTSIGAYLAWTRGIELVGAPRASAFLHLVPIFGAILAWLFLGERLAVYHVIGFVMILAGVTLAARRGSRASRSRPAEAP
jgi:drug/metabolite transporter (DMT)-like permease